MTGAALCDVLFGDDINRGVFTLGDLNRQVRLNRWLGFRHVWHVIRPAGCPAVDDGVSLLP